MGKKRVLSVFGMLFGLAIVLSFFSGSSLGTLSGRVVSGDSYNQEIFIGDHYSFNFNPTEVKIDGKTVYISGTISELDGFSHDLTVKIYSLNSDGQINGEYDGSVFLARGDSLNYKTHFDNSDSSRVKEILIYFDDGRYMIRGDYSLGQTSLTGRVVSGISNGGTYGASFVGIIFAILVCFVIVKTFGKHKSQINLDSALSINETRKFIDLDFR